MNLLLAEPEEDNEKQKKALKTLFSPQPLPSFPPRAQGDRAVQKPTQLG